MFFVSKLIGFVIHPISMSLLLFGAGLLLALTHYRKTSKTLLFISFSYLVALAYTPLSSWMILPLEQRFERPVIPASVDGIISLGGGIDAVVSVPRDVVELANASDRLYETAVLAKRFPNARIVYTGGSGRVFGEKHRSADLAGEFFQSFGIAPERIILEPNARNTAENVRYSQDLVKPKPGEVWIVVTSAFHMPRSIGLFRKAGWTVLPWPCDFQTGGEKSRWDFTNDVTSNFVSAELAVKEWVGLASYYLLGRIDQLLPAPGDEDKR